MNNEQRSIHVPWPELTKRAEVVAFRYFNKDNPPDGGDITDVSVYGVPQGGIIPALLVVQELNKIEDSDGRPYYRAVMTEHLEEANLIIDDLIDSGATMQRVRKLLGSRVNETEYESLIHKNNENLNGVWVVFPWERAAVPWKKEQEEVGPHDSVLRILQFIGENPAREGLKDTPVRVVKSYNEIYGGYLQDPSELFTTFEDGACDEMVVLKDIEFHSTCEHHMQPFFGKAHIAYIPNKRVIGVSKLARLLDAYARRLQIQERIAQQVVDDLMEHLQPLGAACILEAQHFCMVCRGVRKQNSRMVTSCLRGVFREHEGIAARAELFGLIKD